jgi:type III secretion translocon protein HrpF
VNKDGTTQSNLQWAGKQVGDVVLSGFSAFEKAASTVGSFIGDLHIPGISQIASAGSVMAEAWGDGADVAKTAVDGGDVKQAAKNAGIDIAETAAGSLTEIPGAKQAVKGAVDLGGRIVKQGAKKATESTVDGSSSDSSDS